MGNYMEAEDLW